MIVSSGQIRTKTPQPSSLSAEAACSTLGLLVPVIGKSRLNGRQKAEAVFC
jgi:hypothetical protein